MNTPEHRLANLIDEGLRNDANIFIVGLGQGRYEVFGRFLVAPNKQSSCYLVRDTRTNEKQEFSNLKNAMAWCTLMSSKKPLETRRIQSLDLKLYSLTAEIANQRRMLKQSNSAGARLIHLTKLEDASFKRKLIQQQLAEVINNCKALQARKFDYSETRQNRYN